MNAAAEPNRATLRLPHRFGDFLLFDRIGQGGMAEIYLARGRTQLGLDRLAVVKVVLPALSNDARFGTMLVSEAKLAAQLSHANIVQTLDLGREQERLYIAMEYVEGFDLNELLRRCSKSKVALPAEFAFFIVGEALRALDYAHRRTDADGNPLGIVHCDVSPSNVLISLEGEVKLCDFGIARAVNTSEMHPDQIEGKASYMSPEHARGLGVDGRSDVFAASVVLWELLAGRRMVKRTADQDALAIAREGIAPPLPDRGLPGHARLAEIVARGLATDPGGRYPSALTMARDLDDYVMEHRLIASPIRLGEFLMEHFGAEVVLARRARERAAVAIDRGPLVSVTAIASTPGKFDDQTTERDAHSWPEPLPSPVVPLEQSASRRIDPAPDASSAVASSAVGSSAVASASPSAPAIGPPPFQPDDAPVAPFVPTPRFYAVIALAGVLIALLAGLGGWWLAQH